MAARRLSPDERALWARVVAEVKRIPGSANAKTMNQQYGPDHAVLEPTLNLMRDNVTPTLSRTLKQAQDDSARQSPAARVKPLQQNANTLDAKWDRRISRGMLQPDFTIDLHEHTAAQAHARLNGGLALAVTQGARVVLLITGKARGPDNPRLPPTTRGVIRASVTDWLAGSSWHSHIAAIRNAHPRHGGGGALYLILRRLRSALPHE